MEPVQLVVIRIIQIITDNLNELCANISTHQSYIYIYIYIYT